MAPRLSPQPGSTLIQPLVGGFAGVQDIGLAGPADESLLFQKIPSVCGSHANGGTESVVDLDLVGSVIQEQIEHGGGAFRLKPTCRF
jgi:hypothetical protein